MIYIEKKHIYVSISIIIVSLLLFYFLYQQSNKFYKNINWEIFQIPNEDINKEKYLFSELDLKGKNKNIKMTKLIIK